MIWLTFWQLFVQNLLLILMCLTNSKQKLGCAMENVHFKKLMDLSEQFIFEMIRIYTIKSHSIDDSFESAKSDKLLLLLSTIPIRSS